MITMSSRALRRCAAVLLLAALGGWLVTGVGIHRADGAEKLSHAGPPIPPPPPPPPPTLTLDPKEGRPGTSFTVEGSGFSGCPSDEFPSVEVIWDTDQVLDTVPISSDGKFSAKVNVPQNAVQGDHQVFGKGRCGSESRKEIFTVPPPPPPPTLTLDPDEGKPDTPFRAAGRGYSRCTDSEFPQVDVIWDTDQVLATVPMGHDGKFSVEVKVPQTAAPGDHKVIGKCGTESPEAIFTVSPLPTLKLYPDEGSPGSLFEVEGDGYSHCTSDNKCPSVEVFWGANNEKIGTGVMGSDGMFTVHVHVPQMAAPGNHQVIGKFGTESAGANFTVLPVLPQPTTPTLTLNPTEGQPGKLFNVKGSGYSPCTSSECPQVEVFWDTNEKIGTAVMGPNGAFSTDVSVPQTAAQRNHQVVGKFGTESASAVFAVKSPLVDPSVLHLTLIPNEGRSGDFFKIEGSGYNKCPDRDNRVVNVYDRNVSDSNGFSLALARNVPISDQGTFSVIVQMPPTAALGSHEIDARCVGSEEYASAIFAVTGSPPGPPGSPPEPPGSPPGSTLPQFSLPPNPPPDLLPDPFGPPNVHLERAYLATQVPSPTDVFNDPVQLLLGVLLAVLLVLVVAFPAEFFNSTFEKNREKINGWFRWIPRPPRLNLPSWVHLDILGLVAAVLLLMAVVPHPRLDEATLAQAVGYLLAVPLVVVVLEVSGGFYSRWKRPSSTRPEQHEPQWRVVPSALIVAGFLALLSRLAHFSPPYVYGLIAVYIGADRALKNLNKKEEKEERGCRTLIGMLCLFAVSAIAWFAWVPLNHALDQGLDGLGWLVLDAFLATLFLVGLEATVFGMMPLTFLKGEEVWRWKRAVWVAVFLPIVFFFVNVQLAVREAADLTLAEVIKAVVLFFVFGIFSLLFWGYFHPVFRRWFSRLSRPWFSRLVRR